MLLKTAKITGSDLPYHRGPSHPQLGTGDKSGAPGDSGLSHSDDRQSKLILLMILIYLCSS